MDRKTAKRQRRERRLAGRPNRGDMVAVRFTDEGLRVARAMALEIGDTETAAKCERILAIREAPLE